MRSILLFSLLSILLFNCKSQQYTIDTLPEEQLIFGSGGGITGAVDTYIVLENGQVFYHNSLTKIYSEMNSLSKKEAKTFFQKLKVLKLSELNFDHPGNVYYFLEEVKKENRHRIIWGSDDHEISEVYKAFHKELRITIK